MIGYLLPYLEACISRRAPGFSDGSVPSVIYLEIKPRDTLLNYAHGTTNSVDPDQAVYRGLSDPGLHCLLWPICTRGSDCCGI